MTGSSPPIASNLDEFIEKQPFVLDGFQIDAMHYLEGEKNVVVCAPTGAGKTIVAQFAIERTIARKKRAYYTTPLKALSSQKFSELCLKLGSQNVGLITGDMSVRPYAPVVVMTTEVYRNQLYQTFDEGSDPTEEVDIVILDECHYMNDPERGTVWEESIVYTPKEIQILGLSATIANPWDLVGWLSRIHRDTKLVNTSFRPVPLDYFYFADQRIYEITKRSQRSKKLFQAVKRDRGGPRSFQGDRLHYAASRLPEVLRELHRRDFLPAIAFIFSRKGCEQALNFCYEEGLQLLSWQEKERLEVLLGAACERWPNLAEHPHLPALRQGLAVHHAGIWPQWRQLVEQIFEKGLIKGLFATETLAAGINLPARSTILTALSKYTGEGHRTLTGSEFLQMSGRAGRRGLDKRGHVVLVHQRFQALREAFSLVGSRADRLVSNFRPTYQMVLNLLPRQNLEQVHSLLSGSFATFLMQRKENPEHRRLRHLQKSLNKFSTMPCLHSQFQREDYHKQRSLRRSMKKQLEGFQEQRKQSKKVETQAFRLEKEIAKLETTLRQHPCHKCSGCNESKRLLKEKDRLEKEWLSLSQPDLKDPKDPPSWKLFLQLRSLLEEAGYLEEDRLTQLGTIACQLRCSNVILAVEAISRQSQEETTEESLACVITALVTDSSRAADWEPPWDLSQKSERALAQARKASEYVLDIQRRHGLDLETPFEGCYCAIIEQWVRGLSWHQLVRQSGLASGDCFRIIQRTYDLCRQLIAIEGLPQWLRDLAQGLAYRLWRDELVWDLEEEFQS